MKRRRASLLDHVVVWGFALSFLGIFGAACFEGYKVIGTIPTAFQSTASWRNPVFHSDDDPAPSQMTSRQRAEYDARRAERER